MTTTTTGSGTRADRLARARTMTVWELAKIAGCQQPDSPFSHGAAFLTQVRDAVVDTVDCRADWADLSDCAHEIADNAPSVYTHAAWSEFTDLGAWDELLPGEDAAEGAIAALRTGDVYRVPMLATYWIAFRLASTLLDSLLGDSDE